ncbi:MAG: DNA-binding transcriptional LysR family regulator [Oceanospirillaceae bacterium]|jgi:DNA-binding transcriptional LysR family regulator
MPNLDQLEAFVVAAEQGSFSAAARKLGKVQSAISTAIANLEIDTNLILFDRRTRKPKLTEAGSALLDYANNTLISHREFLAHASSLDKVVETHICIAIEQSVSYSALVPILSEFEKKYPFVELELLDSGSSDIASLVRSNRADIGLMLEQEAYPQGFNFRGVGYSQVLPVCRYDHPLVALQPLSLQNLRAHRQMITRSREVTDTTHERDLIGTKKWLLESPYVILELLSAGLGWSYLHEAVVREKLDAKELVELELEFINNQIQQGLDIVWANNRSFGQAGQWLLQRLLTLY